jgi:hypothetical protein
MSQFDETWQIFALRKKHLLQSAGKLLFFICSLREHVFNVFFMNVSGCFAEAAYNSNSGHNALEPPPAPPPEQQQVPPPPPPPLGRNDPYFDPLTQRNVTALVGKSAYLTCRVRNLGNKTVSIDYVVYQNKF